MIMDLISTIFSVILFCLAAVGTLCIYSIAQEELGPKIERWRRDRQFKFKTDETVLIRPSIGEPLIGKVVKQKRKSGNKYYLIRMARINPAAAQWVNEEIIEEAW